MKRLFVLLERVRLRKYCRKSVVKVFLLFSFLSLFLTSLPQPYNPFYPRVYGLPAGITFDGTTGIVTFNQPSTDWITDLYTADTTNVLTLVSSTQRLRFLNYDASRTPTWLDQTTGANNGTADDMYLVPNNPVAVGDEIYFGNENRIFNVVYLNVTTAGVYTSTITWQYRTSGSWTTLFVTQNPNPVFKSLGVGTIKFTPSSNWAKVAVNGVSAYWIRARITTAGTVTTQPKAGRVWLRYTYDSPIRPADDLELFLYVSVESFVSNGTIEIEGTDKGDNPISEIIDITMNMSGAPTTYKYKTITEATWGTVYGIKVSGEFTFYIQQPRWGVMGRLMTWETSKYPYSLLTGIQFGDSSTINDISTSLQQLYVASVPATIQSGVPLYITTGTTLTFGKVKNTALKTVYDGCQIITESIYLTYTEPNSKLYLYDTSIKYASAPPIFVDVSGNENRMWGCLLLGVKIRGINWDINDLNSFSADNAFDAYTAPTTNLNGTFNKIMVTDAQNIFAISSTLEESITVSNLFSRNSTYVVMLAGTFDKNVTLIDPDIDNWNFSFVSTWTGKVFREYTFNLRLTYPNETAYVGANATLTFYGQGGGTVGSWLTDAAGDIPECILPAAFYNATGGDNPYTFNPYNLVITSSAMKKINMNFTVMDTFHWRLPLQFNSAPAAIFKHALSATVNQSVTLDALDSKDTDGSIVNYSWDFGDGNVTSGNYSSIKHVWNVLGSYVVNLTVTDNQGAQNSFATPIVVMDFSDPVARFIFLPSNPEVSQDILFYAGASVSIDGNITSYSWDFGDSITASGVNASHRFAASGTYTVTVSVIDSNNKTDSTSQTLVVTLLPEGGVAINFFTVRIIDWRGTGMFGINVTIVSSDENQPQVFVSYSTNEKGYVNVQLPPNLYHVSATVGRTTLQTTTYHNGKLVVLQYSALAIVVDFLQSPIVPYIPVPCFVWLIIAAIAVVVVLLAIRSA